MPHIEIPYAPREAFIPYHENEKRFALTVAHRRAGKTVARINKAIKAAACCTKQSPRFGYLAPYYVQAKDIAWLYFKHYCGPFIEYGGKFNEAELTITLPHNGAQIKLYGAENAERMRGLYFDGIIIDEAQRVAFTVLRQIIFPCLADRAGWLDASGTPRGWGNLLGELLLIASANPDEWFLQILKASETNIIPKAELDRQRRMMSENEYAQEFECDFDAYITGGVYAKQMSDALTSGRIRPGLYDPNLPVQTFWDIGYDDATSIWWAQFSGGENRCIDYYENSGQDFAHYASQVLGFRVTLDMIANPKNGNIDLTASRHEAIEGLELRRQYHYDGHHGPHDVRNKVLAAGGKSILEQAAVLGLPMISHSASSQQNQIEAGRLTIGNTYFDSEKCKQGIDYLKQYQFEWDDKKMIFKSTPLHDFTSNAADAFEVLAQVRQSGKIEQGANVPRFLDSMTADELFDLHDRPDEPYKDEF